MILIKNKIFIDFDSTTVNTCLKICELYTQDYSNHPDFVEPKWYLIDKWNCSDQCPLLTEEVLNSYFCQERFFENLEYMDWAFTVLGCLYSKGYDITVVTMGEDDNLRLKKEWIDRNLYFCKFIGINFKDYKDKSHIDMSDGILLDDSLSNLLTSNAKYKYVFGDEAEWNRGSEYPRCYNWFEFKKEVERLEYLD